jgi:murein DD-endopeptidase MepM/ murein hydrolase activator NlpD
MARRLIRVGAVAAALACAAPGAAGLAPAPAAAARSADVAALQVALRARGTYAGDVDGITGPGTRAGVARLQARRRLAVDGVAGRATRRALGWRGRPGLGTRAVGVGARGWDVAGMQFLLAVHGFPSGPMDGVLGPRSGAALRRFQAWAGLGADGVAGPATLGRLRGPAPRSPLRFLRPIAAPIGSRFGPRGNWMHTGLDFTAPSGATVRAAGRGCVTSAGWDAGGYGRLVVIAHRMGMTSWYAHLGSIAVRPGGCLVAGTPIGTVGASGHATGPHLHFELRLRAAAIDPLTGF